MTWKLDTGSKMHCRSNHCSAEERFNAFGPDQIDGPPEESSNYVNFDKYCSNCAIETFYTYHMDFSKCISTLL